ncbi:3-oxoacyl-[acyl-carrier-protein] reductase FabG [Vanrija pseudolonga]|uniref:3-oxoacyl-[acyl-carrier-protein] reductase FabG n=1 Tax=Vanrija pseudolonga TaxID=143232 RepID=A0AAF0YA92_9TREE|nr:3-oxoacyl-[acyl-carrier-protein] reductase FabG [Vanrija pseudolonga]
MAPPTTRAAVLSAVEARRDDRTAGTRLAGKVGIITGVGPVNGIGTNAARLFAREQVAAVYFLDLSKELPALADLLRSEYPGVKITAINGDVASDAVVSDVVARALRETGRLDFFFANAGVTQLGRTPPEQLGNKAGAVKEVQQAVRTIATIPGDEFSEVMRINALSVFLAIKYAAPALSVTSAAKPVPGGSIVVTASVAGIRSNAGPIAYSASKAAVISMAQTSAYELAGKNIRVNAICPGLIETNMTKALFTLARGSGKGDAVGQLNPLHRYGLPYEIASAALFLVSDESSYVNGQAVAVDGGLSGGHPYARL